MIVIISLIILSIIFAYIGLKIGDWYTKISFCFLISCVITWFVIGCMISESIVGGIVCMNVSFLIVYAAVS